MTKRELILLSVLGALFPIYPAILLQEVRHGHVSVVGIVVISLASGILLPLFARRGLKLNVGIDIRRHLDEHYSPDQQRRIIVNYFGYTNRYLEQTPLFRRAAMAADPILRQYRAATFLLMGKLAAGFLTFVALLGFVLYVLT